MQMCLSVFFWSDVIFNDSVTYCKLKEICLMGQLYTNFTLHETSELLDCPQTLLEDFGTERSKSVE